MFSFIMFSKLYIHIYQFIVLFCLLLLALTGFFTTKDQLHLLASLWKFITFSCLLISADSKSSLKAIGHVADVLPGFRKASSSLQPRKNFAPPQLPKDFRPFHRFDSSRPTATTKSGPTEQKKLDAFSRGTLLGEAPHLSQCKMICCRLDI
jgi:hypothetical protein